MATNNFDTKDLYIKGTFGYVSIGSIKAGRIELTNGNLYVIGEPEDIFNLDMSDSDKNFMSDMKIALNT